MGLLYKIFIGDSWKSTLSGYALAVAYALQAVLSQPTFTTRDIILAAAMAILGRFINEFGKKEQPPDNNPDNFKDRLP